eukprot:1407835-Amphidinium_carterae.2
MSLSEAIYCSLKTREGTTVLCTWYLSCCVRQIYKRGSQRSEHHPGWQDVHNWSSLQGSESRLRVQLCLQRTSTPNSMMLGERLRCVVLWT